MEWNGGRYRQDIAGRYTMFAEAHWQRQTPRDVSGCGCHVANEFTGVVVPGAPVCRLEQRRQLGGGTRRPLAVNRGRTTTTGSATAESIPLWAVSLLLHRRHHLPPHPLRRHVHVHVCSHLILHLNHEHTTDSNKPWPMPRSFTGSSVNLPLGLSCPSSQRYVSLPGRMCLGMVLSSCA